MNKISGFLIGFLFCNFIYANDPIRSAVEEFFLSRHYRSQRCSRIELELGRAQGEMDAGNYSKAADILRGIRETQERDVVLSSDYNLNLIVLHNLALVQERLGQTEAALETLRRAVAMGRAGNRLYEITDILMNDIRRINNPVVLLPQFSRTQEQLNQDITAFQSRGDDLEARRDLAIAYEELANQPTTLNAVRRERILQRARDIIIDLLQAGAPNVPHLEQMYFRVQAQLVRIAPEAAQARAAAPTRVRVPAAVSGGSR